MEPPPGGESRVEGSGDCCTPLAAEGAGSHCDSVGVLRQWRPSLELAGSKIFRILDVLLNVQRLAGLLVHSKKQRLERARKSADIVVAVGGGGGIA
jgi:hypothetical protein